MGHPPPHSGGSLGSELFFSVSQRQRPGPSCRGRLPEAFPRRGPPEPTVTMCLHICATGLPNRPFSSFSACSLFSSSPGTRSSSLAGPTSSPPGEPLGPQGMESNREDSGVGAGEAMQRGKPRLGLHLLSWVISNSFFFYPPKSLGLDDKAFGFSGVTSFDFGIRRNWVRMPALPFIESLLCAKQIKTSC